MLRISVGSRDTRVFLVANPRALSQLEADEVVDLDDDEILIIQSEGPSVVATRSPRARYGRKGDAGARLVNMEELCADVSTADELYEALQLEGGI